jgi:hypothetical protein
MLITVEIKNCEQCRHMDHSGAKLICGHPDIYLVSGFSLRIISVIYKKEIGKE